MSTPSSPTPALELRALAKRFGDVVAVDDVSLSVPRGTVYGLLGPNGAGKTTTIRMIMDIIAPDSGAVQLFGRPRERDDLDRIGYLPEERGLYRKMTVRAQLAFLGELHGLPRDDLDLRIDRWLERLEIADRADTEIETLSKGMQQKIQLVGTLLHEPELLILDEPFSGLDPINQELFKQALADHKSAGRTVIFSTHVMEQAEKLCDHICLISKGRAILSGLLTEIKREYGGGWYRLGVDAPTDRVAGVDGVDEAIEHDGYLKVLLKPTADPAAVLTHLVEQGPVREFHSEEPELAEIFVTAVRDAE